MSSSKYTLDASPASVRSDGTANTNYSGILDSPSSVAIASADGVQTTFQHDTSMISFGSPDGGGRLAHESMSMVVTNTNNNGGGVVDELSSPLMAGGGGTDGDGKLTSYRDFTTEVIRTNTHNINESLFKVKMLQHGFGSFQKKVVDDFDAVYRTVERRCASATNQAVSKLSHSNQKLEHRLSLQLESIAAKQRALDSTQRKVTAEVKNKSEQYSAKTTAVSAELKECTDAIRTLRAQMETLTRDKSTLAERVYNVEKSAEQHSERGGLGGGSVDRVSSQLFDQVDAKLHEATLPLLTNTAQVEQRTASLERRFNAMDQEERSLRPMLEALAKKVKTMEFDAQQVVQQLEHSWTLKLENVQDTHRKNTAVLERKNVELERTLRSVSDRWKQAEKMLTSQLEELAQQAAARNEYDDSHLVERLDGLTESVKRDAEWKVDAARTLATLRDNVVTHEQLTATLAEAEGRTDVKFARQLTTMQNVAREAVNNDAMSAAATNKAVVDAAEERLMALAAEQRQESVRMVDTLHATLKTSIADVAQRQTQLASTLTDDARAAHVAVDNCVKDTQAALELQKQSFEQTIVKMQQTLVSVKSLDALRVELSGDTESVRSIVSDVKTKHASLDALVQQHSQTLTKHARGGEKLAQLNQDIAALRLSQQSLSQQLEQSRVEMTAFQSSCEQKEQRALAAENENKAARRAVDEEQNSNVQRQFERLESLIKTADDAADRLRRAEQDDLVRSLQEQWAKRDAAAEEWRHSEVEAREKSEMLLADMINEGRAQVTALSSVVEQHEAAQKRLHSELMDGGKQSVDELTKTVNARFAALSTEEQTRTSSMRKEIATATARLTKCEASVAKEATTRQDTVAKVSLTVAGVVEDVRLLSTAVDAEKKLHARRWDDISQWRQETATVVDGKLEEAARKEKQRRQEAARVLNDKLDAMRTEIESTGAVKKAIEEARQRSIVEEEEREKQTTEWRVAERHAREKADLLVLDRVHELKQEMAAREQARRKEDEARWKQEKERQREDDEWKKQEVAAREEAETRLVELNGALKEEWLVRDELRCNAEEEKRIAEEEKREEIRRELQENGNVLAAKFTKMQAANDDALAAIQSQVENAGYLSLTATKEREAEQQQALEQWKDDLSARFAADHAKLRAAAADNAAVLSSRVEATEADVRELHESRVQLTEAIASRTDAVKEDVTTIEQRIKLMETRHEQAIANIEKQSAGRIESLLAEEKHHRAQEAAEEADRRVRAREEEEMREKERVQRDELRAAAAREQRKVWQEQRLKDRADDEERLLAMKQEQTRVAAEITAHTRAAQKEMEEAAAAAAAQRALDDERSAKERDAWMEKERQERQAASADVQASITALQQYNEQQAEKQRERDAATAKREATAKSDMEATVSGLQTTIETKVLTQLSTLEQKVVAVDGNAQRHAQAVESRLLGRVTAVVEEQKVRYERLAAADEERRAKAQQADEERERERQQREEERVKKSQEKQLAWEEERKKERERDEKRVNAMREAQEKRMADMKEEETRAKAVWEEKMEKQRLENEKNIKKIQEADAQRELAMEEARKKQEENEKKRMAALAASDKKREEAMAAAREKQKKEEEERMAALRAAQKANDEERQREMERMKADMKKEEDRMREEAKKQQAAWRKERDAERAEEEKRLAAMRKADEQRIAEMTKAEEKRQADMAEAEVKREKAWAALEAEREKKAAEMEKKLKKAREAEIDKEQKRIQEARDAQEARQAEIIKAEAKREEAREKADAARQKARDDADAERTKKAEKLQQEREKRMQQEKEESEARLEKQATAIEKAKAQWQKQQAKDREDMKVLVDEVSQHAVSIEDVQNDIKALAQADDINERLDELTESLTTVRESMELAEGDLDRCVAEIKTLKSEVANEALETEEKVQDMVDKVRDELEANVDDIEASLRADMKETMTQVTTFANKFEAVDAQIAGKFTKFKNMIDDAESKAAARESKSVKIDMSLKSLTRRMNEVEEAVKG